MSGDNYKFQASLKFGPGGSQMMNVRADTAEEFQQNLNEALAALGPTAVLVDAYNTEFQGANTPPPSNAGNGQAQAQSSGELCQHGSMVFRSGNKDGKAWSGWFCPTDKNDPGKCKPKFTPSAR